MHKQDEGDMVLLGLRLMLFTVASELGGNQGTASLKTARMDEDVGGSNLVLEKAGEVNGVDCTEVVTNPVPVCIGKGRKPPT